MRSPRQASRTRRTVKTYGTIVSFRDLEEATNDALALFGNKDARGFQQTMKKWLRAQPTQPATLEQLQALLDAFADGYNQHRPHRSLPHRGTPAATYTALPKALPVGSRDGDTHHRVRHDRVDKTGCVTLRHAGRLHHIGIGRTHTGTHVILLTHDLHVRVINALTGELLRELTLDPTRDYQPTGRPPGPTPRKPNGPNPQ